MELNGSNGAEERPPCDELYEDDGVDPRTYFDRRSAERRGVWALQRLCSQVAETLQVGLSWASAEPALWDVEVGAVEPDPDASRLLVTVHARTASEVAAVRLALRRAAPFLRTEVAENIHRRRTPELRYRVEVDDA